MRRGFDVTALTRKPTQIFGCRILVADLNAPASYAAEVEAAGGIVHLASSRSFERQAVFGDIAGSANLIEHWKRGSFVCSSSGLLYANRNTPLTEETPLAPNGYALGKLSDEFQLRVATSNGSRGPAICLRPGILLGAGPRRNDERTFSTVYQYCQANAKFRFWSEESLETFGSSYIGTADYARAVADALGPKASGVYNVAGGFCTWRSLIETINRIAGTHADFLIRPDGSTDPGEFWLPQSRVFLDVSAFKAQTAFVPQQSLEQLVQEFVAAERATVSSNPGVKAVN
jgi:nucleoside-diphosphate-sugar epimerase